MTLAVLGPVLMAGSLSIVDLVESQRTVWFVVPQFLAFYVFLVTMTAEVNRSPFDLPEAESELVAGFHTEYSGLKFGFFYLAEYANMFLAAAIMSVLFFGGWKGFFEIPIIGEFLSSFIWFMAKCVMWLCIFVWFRATFPRFRIDHMMDYAWKVLLPIAMINVIVTCYFAFSDYNFTVWIENNWKIYNDYIRPLFFNEITSMYAIPIMIIIGILVLNDALGSMAEIQRKRFKDGLRKVVKVVLSDANVITLCTVLGAFIASNEFRDVAGRFVTILIGMFLGIAVGIVINYIRKKINKTRKNRKKSVEGF
jgi:hypothetical protein